MKLIVLTTLLVATTAFDKKNYSTKPIIVTVQKQTAAQMERHRKVIKEAHDRYMAEWRLRRKRPQFPKEWKGVKEFEAIMDENGEMICIPFHDRDDRLYWQLRAKNIAILRRHNLEYPIPD
jgi:hypothetical protein